MPEHADDRALVEQMLAGDEGAFEAFGERSFRPLLRFALGRLGGDRELAREIVQTTLTRALSKIESYRGEASLSTWLCACCRNEIRMHFRSTGARPVEVELPQELAETAGPRPARAAGPEESLLADETATLVHVALDSLPARYAQALEWKYLENRRVDEIAARLELGTKAAESLLTRARGAFRKIYAGLCGGAAPASESQEGADDERARAAT